MRFLFAWEQGGGNGHLSVMLPIAGILKERGHEVLFAVKEVGIASQLFVDKDFSYVQAPIPNGLKKPRRDAASFADVLAEAGFGDSAILGGMVRSWQTIFSMILGKLSSSHQVLIVYFILQYYYSIHKLGRKNFP